MRTLVLLLAATVALAGCQDLVDAVGGGSDARPTAARIVTADIDEQTFMGMAGVASPDDALAAFFDTVFEYTHRGGDVDPGELDVSFLDKDGDRTNRAMDRFTTAGTLKDGDVVRITGVHLASDLKITRGADVLLERPGVERDWFTAGGAPLPIAAGPGALATWHAEGSGGMRVEVTDGTFEADGESAYVRDLLYDVSASSTGGMDLRFEDDELTFSADVEGDASLTVDIDAQTQVEGERLEVLGSVDGEAEWSAEGKAVFGFEGRHLASVGGSGSVYADATYEGYMDVGGEREELDDADVPHPLVDESLPFTEEDVDLDNIEDPSIIDFLARLWAADLAVGDRISVSFDQEDISVDFEIEVAGADTRELAGQDLDTFRVLERLDYEAPGMEPFSSEATYWIHQESHLPVFAEIKESRTLGAEDLQDMVGAAEVPVTLPDDLEVVYTTDATFRLTEYQEGLAVPGLMAMQGMRSGGFAVVGAAAGFVMVQGLGDTGDSAPDISFTKDEADDQITVARAETGTSWWEFSFRSTAPVRFAMNEQAGPGSDAIEPGVSATPWDGGDVLAGDFVSLCAEDGASNVELTVIHDMSNSQIAMFTFSSIAAC